MDTSSSETFKSLLQNKAKEGAIKCNHCGYASREPSNLRRHIKTHSGEKVHKC